MLLQPIADRLVAANIGYRKVAGAADFAAGKEDLRVWPTGYVIPLGDQAQPNTLLGYSASQYVVERFAVILAVDNKRDVRGDAVNAALETIRAATILNLLGFQPATDYDPIQYGGGRLLELDVSTMWWQLEFITGYFETKI
jgi:hypothetical protein